jgi:hypothetical protein
MTKAFLRASALDAFRRIQLKSHIARTHQQLDIVSDLKPIAQKSGAGPTMW